VRFRFSRFFSFAEIKKDFVTEKARDINIRGEELERCFWLASQIMPKCCVWIDHITLWIQPYLFKTIHTRRKCKNGSLGCVWDRGDRSIEEEWFFVVWVIDLELFVCYFWFL